jgi:hypothetical protein
VLAKSQVWHNLIVSSSDFNQGESLFRVAFLLAELPSQLISKKLGPDRWIPIQMCVWSIVAMAQAAVQGKGTYMMCRVLLGALEVTTGPTSLSYLALLTNVYLRAVSFPISCFGFRTFTPAGSCRPGWVSSGLPWVSLAFSLLLWHMVYSTSKDIWVLRDGGMIDV